MTYHNKLLLRRALIVLAIVAAVVFLLLLIVFFYLGRYVVYTEDGAQLVFESAAPSQSSVGGVTALPGSSLDLVTGEPISTNEVLESGKSQLEANEVRGLLLDYDTLADGTTLGEVELSSGGNNTLILEMRRGDSEMLDTQAIRTLIARAESQDVWLVAMLSCLGDSDYALENRDQAVIISGGALWIENGCYWLDPANSQVHEYLLQKIRQLADMGFDEVLLNDYYIPTNNQVVYDAGGESYETIMTRAFNNLVDDTIDLCQLSLLVTEPASGHQAFDAADRIYVFYQDGGTVRDYAESHADQYLVFITDSHDTRFDEYGKIMTEIELDVARIDTEEGEEGDGAAEEE